MLEDARRPIELESNRPFNKLHKMTPEAGRLKRALENPQANVVIVVGAGISVSASGRKLCSSWGG